MVWNLSKRHRVESFGVLEAAAARPFLLYTQFSLIFETGRCLKCSHLACIVGGASRHYLHILVTRKKHQFLVGHYLLPVTPASPTTFLSTSMKTVTFSSVNFIFVSCSRRFLDFDKSKFMRTSHYPDYFPPFLSDLIVIVIKAVACSAMHV